MYIIYCVFGSKIRLIYICEPEPVLCLVHNAVIISTTQHNASNKQSLFSSLQLGRMEPCGLVPINTGHPIGGQRHSLVPSSLPGG